MAKYLVSHPCQDACGTIETDRDVRGAPVYLCPGCDSEWYEPREEKVIADDRGQSEDFSRSLSSSRGLTLDVMDDNLS